MIFGGGEGGGLLNHHNPYANGPALKPEQKARLINHMISSANQSKLMLKELAIGFGFAS